MKRTRETKAKLNILTTLSNQLISTICGIIIPRAMIGAFGSAIYGATTSIAQFLSYISLLENGIGRVTRGALYKPLAQEDWEGTSKVYQEVKLFFRKLAIIFVIYTLLVAMTYHDIAKIEVLTRNYIFLLVLVISISTFAKYMGGLAKLTLLNADQKQYITNLVTLLTTILNTCLIVLLVNFKYDVLTVKLGSSLVFTLRPVIFSIYVKRNYQLPEVQRDKNVLSQKWTGFGQHLAYFIHTNTDVILLTIFGNLELVAVYSVYSLVVNSIRNIVSSFSGGMEAFLGNMIAKNEIAELRKTYRQYKLLLSTVSIMMFSTTAALIVPFVKLYTRGITDVNYIQPLFALVLLMAEALNCISLPYSTLPISANKLKETRWGAYGEAIINVVFTLILIFWNPLLGVALGTFIATAFKSIYYLYYAEKYILKNRKENIFVEYMRNFLVMGIFSGAGMYFVLKLQINGFWGWILYAFATSLLIGSLTLMYVLIFYKEDRYTLKKMLMKIVKRKKYVIK